MKLFRNFVLFLLLSPALLRAQARLQQQVTFSADGQALGSVLHRLGTQVHCSFSYNSNILNEDKTVHLQARQEPLSAVLDQLLGPGYQYKEQDQYIIIRPAGKTYTISGYVKDGQTGLAISDAIVYESNLLASAQTDAQGYFRLPIRFKDKYTKAQLSISKDHYHVRSMQIDAGYDQEIVVPIVAAESELDNVVIESAQKVENSWLGRFFLSADLKNRSRNIGNFIARRPVQGSIIPGWGTHGKLGAQVTNIFSLNIIGGYTAGVRGVEIGSIFNIVKGDVGYVQVAGIFNLVGGSVTGVQVSGIFNRVFDSLTGVQVAGLCNNTKGTVTGVQVAGLGNNTNRSVLGAQVAGLSNTTRGPICGIQIAGLQNINRRGNITGIQIAGLLNWNQGPGADTPAASPGNRGSRGVRGVQIAGLQNINRRGNFEGVQIAGLLNWNQGAAEGVQVAGLLNKAKHMRGVQLAVVNIADTLDGYSLGLINYVRSGYHALAIYATELQGFNLAYRSGNPHLYSIISGAAAFNTSEKSYSAGYGFGNKAPINERLAIHTELLTQGWYLGDWHTLPVSVRLQPALTYKLCRSITCFAGPSFTLLTGKRSTAVPGYLPDVSAHAGSIVDFGSTVCGWFGFQAGITLF